MIKTVYVAGPLTPVRKDKNYAVSYLDNVRHMIKVSCYIAELGFSPFCPALGFNYFLHGSTMTEEAIKRIDMDWLKVSDAVLVIGDWSLSDGTKAEIATATKLGIPIFYDIMTLKKTAGMSDE